MAPPPPQMFKRDGPTMFVKRQGPSDTDTDTTTPTSSSSSTTPTSSSTTPSSSSSTTPTSSSTTPSSSSSSTTSSTPTSTTPSTTSTPTPTLNTTASTRPDGGVVTLTLTSTPSATPTGNNGGGGGGFWNNKAEVGAVFGIAGAIGLVLIFIAVTTAVRRRRARKFDRDVAEAAAAAASASANPFFDDEDERGNNGANWDPRRGSAHNAGYGKIHDDPYGYAAAGVVGGAGAGFARQNTNQFQQRNPQDAYSMNDLASSGHQMSSYSGGTTYNQSSSGAGYYDMPQPDYGRPSFSSNTAPGIAGVGAAGALAGAGTGAGQNQNQNLRYRGQPQQQRPLSSGSDAYGGYSDDYDRYPNPYAANPASTAFVQNTPGSQENHGNMVNQAYRAQSPPGRQTSPPLPAVPNSSSPPPPPSYSGHGHTNSAGQDLKFAGAARPSSEWQHGLVAASGSQGQLAPMSPPNASLPATPDESYDQKGRILRVANE